VAKGNSAIHAARALLLEFGDFHVMMEFVPILDALDRGSIQRQLAEILNKSGRFSHSSDS
jgi:hypothetical protein